MDTRSKIVSLEAALEAAQAPKSAAITGYFDPVTVEHARSLEASRRECGGPLVVFITEPPEPVMSAAARAEVVAGIAAVDLVALAPDGVDVTGARHEERADADRFERLLDRVNRRR